MKGQKCFDLAEMIIIARASDVPVPSEGLSVSLMHFPSLFLKHIIIEWPSFEFVQQIMSQKKHIFISRSMNVSMKYLRKCAKYLSWNMFEYLKRSDFKSKQIYVWMRQNKYVLISRISSVENILLVLSLELRVLITCLAALPSLCDGQVSLTIYDYVSQHRLLCLPSVKFCFDFLSLCSFASPFLCFFTHVDFHS